MHLVPQFLHLMPSSCTCGPEPLEFLALVASGFCVHGCQGTETNVKTVHEFEPHIGLCVVSSEPGACFSFCVSLSLFPFPTSSLSLSLS